MTGSPSARLRLEQLESRLQPSVTYHGGALLTHVEAQAVYLGSDWTATTAAVAESQTLDKFVSYIVNSPYTTVLGTAGYGVGTGTASTGAVLGLSLNKAYYLTDAQIRADIQAGIKAGTLQAPDANRLYVVYVEAGVAVSDGNSTSTNSFLGYHGAFAGTTAAGAAADIRYAVLPHPGGYNPSPASQGFASAFNELTAVSSHEIAEAITDPDVNYKQLGWYDARLNGEIGDITAGDLATLNGYVVQLVAGPNDQPLALTGGGVSNPPPPPPPPTGHHHHGGGGWGWGGWASVVWGGSSWFEVETTHRH